MDINFYFLLYYFIYEKDIRKYNINNKDIKMLILKKIPFF
jgi:hypothetical protein